MALIRNTLFIGLLKQNNFLLGTHINVDQGI